MSGSKVRRSRIRAALVAVLAITLVLGTFWAAGATGSPSVAKASAPRALYSMAVIPAAFHPVDDDADFGIGTQVVQVNSGGSADFVAQVFFGEPVVTLRKLTLIGYDNGPGDICLEVGRYDPDGTAVSMAEVCSSGTPASFSLSQLTSVPRRVLMRHGVWLLLTVPSNSQQFYGARIVYGI